MKVAIFIVALVVVTATAAYLTGYILERNWKRKEKKDGHRRDRTHNQGGPVKGTSGYSISLTPPNPIAWPRGGTYSSLEHANALIRASKARALAKELGIPSQMVSAAFDMAVEKEEQPEEEQPEELDVYTAPVFGFRSWRMRVAPMPGLMGYQKYTWKPGRNTAQCFITDRYSSKTHPCEEVPGEGCTCGMYALRDMFDTNSSYGTILGGVVGWGKVIDGTKGWKAEHAAVAALFVPSAAGTGDIPSVEDYQLFAEIYQVPLCFTPKELFDKTQELVDWMAAEDLLEEDKGDEA